MKKFQSGIILILIAFVTVSCDKEKHNPLTGCCGNPGIDEQIGNGHIYVPNIFTPNGDNINDFFIIFGDSVRLITNLEIKNASGTVVFSRANFIPNQFDAGWDGYTNGVVVEGLYAVSFTVEAENGTIKVLHSEVCNYPCDSNGNSESVKIEKCQFPIQSDHGHFGSTFSSNEGPPCFY